MPIRNGAGLAEPSTIWDDKTAAMDQSSSQGAPYVLLTVPRLVDQFYTNKGEGTAREKPRLKKGRILAPVKKCLEPLKIDRLGLPKGSAI